MTHAGAAAILLAFVLIGAHAGGQSFAAIRAHAGGVPPAVRSLAFVLALAGFASKAGAVPLHVWLPRAHPEAPSPVSALMSGAMVNLGIYGIVRTGDGLLGGGELWWWLAVAGLGVASALFGAHPRRGEPGPQAAARLLHGRQHGACPDRGRRLGRPRRQRASRPRRACHDRGAVPAGRTTRRSRDACSWRAGSVQRAAGTRDLDSLGGLLRRLPVTAALFGIGALSICALPPFSGFASEWLLLQGFLRGFSAHGAATATALLAGVAALALTGGLTAAAFVKAFGIGFLGQPRTPAAAAAGEAAPAMVAGTALLAVPVRCPRRDPGCRHAAAGQGGGHRAGRHAAGSAARGRRPGDRRQRRRDPAGAAGRRAARRAGSRLGACPPPRPRQGAARGGLGMRPGTADARGCSTPRRRSPSRCSASSTTCCAPTVTSMSATSPSHATSRRRFATAAGSTTLSSAAAYRPLIVLASRWGEVARRAQNGSMHRYLGYGFAALVVLLVVLA